MTSAPRQKRYRDRRRAGLLRVTIFVNEAVVDALIATGQLEEWDDQDREAIARAVERTLGMPANDA